MKTALSKPHQATYDAIFRHPIASNLDWRDLRSMLGDIGEISNDEAGHFKVSSGDETLLLHPGTDKTLGDAGVLMDIRRFLKRLALDTAAVPQPDAHLLVVIDHREARIFSTELHGEAPHRITPYDPHGFGRALHYNQNDSSGQRKPELKSYYEAIAATLKGAKKILIFGAGTGMSSAMEQLLMDFQHNHHDLADRVVGSITIDEHHLTDDQLLAKAREFYATPASAAV